MTPALGDFDEFAIECRVVDRDHGAVLECLEESPPGGKFSLVQFMDEDHPKLVQADVPAGTEDYDIDAELDFGSDYGGDAHSLAEAIHEAIEHSGYSVINESGSMRYYIVSEVSADV